ncbi:hypothetical protein PPYR_09076 [Photinus pyralis]|uniref:Mff-like domain-containing protein n=1 Tax=Photinus pyralis TaxID=7054 RepID=A0A1Y1L8C9_PHOPY|nr:transport and Golgi organization protein 11 [Photinus pyralis]XP_031343662.1 transport and Golgi organization protein 11 [Photinus pyralis]KAB0798083.1 hypothetical protein PPYR_09076 [Photinus pyralis]
MSATTELSYPDIDENYISDVNFKVDIGQRMKVPNKISFNPDAPTNGVTTNPWGSELEVLNMQVPDRILVVGQDQHIGTRAPPREIVYDNSILPKDPYPGDVRVGTPPRMLTLDKYQFPGVNDTEPKAAEIPNKHVKSKTQVLSELRGEELVPHRESTPPLNISLDPMSTTDEILHLRRQMAKLNRRVMALELENLSRLQKEKIFYGIGIAYFLLKTLIWLNRSY